MSIEGLRISIERARLLYPKRQVFVMVDRPCDIYGRLFERYIPEKVILIDVSKKKDFSVLNHSNSVVVIGFNSDESVCIYLRRFTEMSIKYVCSNDSINARWWNISNLAEEALISERQDCIVNGYSHFASDQLANIMQVIDMTVNLSGQYVEIGVFRGTSARSAINYMVRRNLEREVFLLDTYEGFNYEESKESSDAFWQETHTADMSRVIERVNRTPGISNEFKEKINVQKCNIVSDKLPKNIDSICICNIDVDMYEAVLKALEKVWHLMVSGGVVIVQDPGRTPLLGGARLALKLFLESTDSNEYFTVYLESGQTLIIKR